MLDWLNSDMMRLMHKTLNFRSQRQEVLASNVANMDTPGYQAEDLVFENALEKALHTDQPGPMKTTNARHFTGVEEIPIEQVQAERIKSAAATVDASGNSVNLDKEMAKIAENQLMYNATAKMVSHQLELLKISVTER